MVNSESGGESIGVNRVSMRVNRRGDDCLGTLWYVIEVIFMYRVGFIANWSDDEPGIVLWLIDDMGVLLFLRLGHCLGQVCACVLFL